MSKNKNSNKAKVIATNQTISAQLQSASTSNSSFMLAAFFLAIVVFIAFSPTLSNQFNHYDDQYYITENAAVKSGLNPESIRSAFTSIVVSNWHPVTMLSHMLDCQLFGLDPAAHHAMNLLYHCIAAILLFYILYSHSRMLWPSLLTALIFAIHPLRVESVAWAAERKDVLSGIFFFLSIILYKRYLIKKSLLRYGVLAVAFTLGLMTKPMLVTLPFVLLLLDYYPLKRFEFDTALFFNKEKRALFLGLIFEKILLFLIAGIFSVITFAVQKGDNAVFNIPFGVRFLNAASSYLVYIKQLFLPINLTLFYPHPFTTGAFSVAWGITALLILTLITVMLFINNSKHKPLLAAWLWFIGLLVPVIGIIQVGDQAHADRYTYLPLIGIVAVIVWGGYLFVLKHKSFRLLAIISAALVVIVLIALTRYQTAFWKDDVTLFTRAVNVTKKNYKMEYNLGIALRSKGDLAGALDHFLKTKEYNPGDNMVYMDISSIYMSSGKFNEQIKLCSELIERHPKSWQGYYGRGVGYYMAQKIDSARSDFAQALPLKIDDPQALEQLLQLAVGMKDTNLVNVSGVQLIQSYSDKGNVELAQKIKKVLFDARYLEFAE